MLPSLYSDRSYLPGSNSLPFLDSSARAFFLLCTRRHSLFCLSEGQAQCQLTLASIGQQRNIHRGACASLHGSLSGAHPTAHGRSGRPFLQRVDLLIPASAGSSTSATSVWAAQLPASELPPLLLPGFRLSSSAATDLPGTPRGPTPSLLRVRTPKFFLPPLHPQLDPTRCACPVPLVVDCYIISLASVYDHKSPCV